MSRKKLSKKVKKEIVDNVWNIDPGMATSADLLNELRSRGYNIPKKLNTSFLGRILNDSGCFDRVQISDRRLTDILSLNSLKPRKRVFYKKKR